NGLNTNYQIHVNNLIVGGISAGSLIAMNSVYYQTQSMINAIFGTAIQVDDGTNKSVLGPIDADYYYGASNVEYFSRVKCVLNLWGSMFIPKNKINNIFSSFLQDIVSFIPILTLDVSQLILLEQTFKNFNLDYDDSYQLIAAQANNLEIVTLDKDFKKIKDSIKTHFL
ncbi:MAG: hypothetical protein ABI405_05055, partial [Parafilimonas sp.]